MGSKVNVLFTFIPHFGFISRPIGTSANGISCWTSSVTFGFHFQHVSTVGILFTIPCSRICINTLKIWMGGGKLTHFFVRKYNAYLIKKHKWQVKNQALIQSQTLGNFPYSVLLALVLLNLWSGNIGQCTHLHHNRLPAKWLYCVYTSFY